MNRLKLDIQRFADGEVIIKAELDTKNFEQQIESTETELNRMVKQYNRLQQVAAKGGKVNQEQMQNLATEIEKTTNKLVNLKKKQSELNRVDYSGIKNSISGIGESIKGVTKKVVKWGLAIFGIRSAYMLVRQAMSTLSQYDDQLATNIEYMRWVIAMTIKPVIEWIIKAVYNLLGFLGGILNDLFGINIFANATADAFVKAKKALKDSNKQASELKKTLAGFDEMNILQDDGSTSPIGTPNIDFGNFLDDDKKDEISSFWDDIFKFWDEEWLDFFSSFTGNWSVFIEGLGFIFKGLYDVISGLGEVVWGVLEFIVGIFTGDMDLISQAWGIMCDGLYNILKGVLEIIVGLLEGAVGIIVGIVKTIWDLIVQIISGIAQWVYEHIIFPIQMKFELLWTALTTAVTNTWNGIKKIIGSIASWVNNKIIKPIASFFSGLWNGIVNGANNIIGGIKTAFNTIKNWLNNYFIKPVSSFFSGLWNGLTSGLSAAADTIGSIFNGIKNVICGAVNLVIDGINLLIDGMNFVNPFKDIPHIPHIGESPKKRASAGGGTGAWGGGSGGGGGTRAKGGIFYPSKLPKLAVGGIINMPGKGVPYNGAIIGERGAEAVVPLTDSQQMALLGEAIGKYITVNANITTMMNGRIISRELQRVQSENDFAYNR